MAPNSRDRSIFILEQGTIATACLDALNRMMDSVAKL